MVLPLIGAGIAAGANILGGILSRNKEAKTQEKFAKNAIQWKVADSLQAGIHPLFGLGANTAQYSPTNIVGESIGRAGQDIGQAVDRMRTTDQLAGSLQHKILGNQVRRGELENMLLESQLARQAQTPTPAPPAMSGDMAIIPGQGDTRRPDLVQGGGPRLPVGLPVIGNVQPRASESPHQDVENEYGEIANLPSAYRAIRDMSPQMEAYLAAEWQKVLRNTPNDLFYVKRKPLRGTVRDGKNTTIIYKNNY